jgi:hypothetical protein
VDNDEDEPTEDVAADHELAWEVEAAAPVEELATEALLAAKVPVETAATVDAELPEDAAADDELARAAVELAARLDAAADVAVDGAPVDEAPPLAVRAEELALKEPAPEVSWTS